MQIEDLEMRIARALRQQSLEHENVTLRQQLDQKFGLENIVGQSAAMQVVFDVIRQVAPSRSTVLIEGESGTGKELIAKAFTNSVRGAPAVGHRECAACLPPFSKVNYLATKGLIYGSP